jgi:hypothetical protein
MALVRIQDNGFFSYIRSECVQLITGVQTHTNEDSEIYGIPEIRNFNFVVMLSCGQKIIFNYSTLEEATENFESLFSELPAVKNTEN